jgi:outer membrane protein assembly factor BamE (lipoprotein component of BamABCDE complex)
MKSAILLLALAAAALSSCSTAYKTGQTPDDVYYSPAKPQDEYVQTDNNDEQKYRGDDYYDDRYLRMKVHNRTQWSELDDWYYYGNHYNYTSYNCYCFNNPWSPYTYWNNYYNPYYHGYVIISPQSGISYNKPHMTNLNTFNNNMLTSNNYSNPKTPGANIKVNSNNSGNTNSNAGNFLRNIFNGGSNNNSGNSSSHGSGSSSSSSSSGSSGSSGSSAPVRKF